MEWWRGDCSRGGEQRGAGARAARWGRPWRDQQWVREVWQRQPGWMGSSASCQCQEHTGNTGSGRGARGARPPSAMADGEVQCSRTPVIRHESEEEAEGKGRGAHSEPAGVRERARGGLAGANRWRRCRRPQVDDDGVGDDAGVLGSVQSVQVKQQSPEKLGDTSGR